MTARRIVPVARKIDQRSQGTDFAYWQSQPLAARLATLEDIRRKH